MAVLVPHVGQLYVGCGTCTISLADQRTLATWLYHTLPIDPRYWLIFGAAGLWIMTLALAGFRAAALSKWLAAAGVALALASWLLVAGAPSAVRHKSSTLPL